ncbi:serine protease HTRA2, mitochondrial-like [Styela clava]
MASGNVVHFSKHRNPVVLLRRICHKEGQHGNNAKVATVARPYSQGSDQNNQNNGNKKIPITLFGAMLGISSGAVLLNKKRNSQQPSILHAAEGEDRAAGGGSSRRNNNNFIADVVEMSGSAVVFIARFAKVPFMRKQVEVSHGSGFIVESQGLVITNAHVVGNQSKLKVRLQDGREFEGVVLGVDEGLDLAAVEIRSRDLPYLPLGCSNDIRPGEWVVAMGSPLNLKNTVTAGIVSNIHRAGKELGLHDHETRDMEYIQTDAMINFGNSGGPLINLDGEVIGVNSMMASAGIGFAIPVDYVKDFLTRLKEALKERRRSSSGHARLPTGRRKYIGITMLTLTEDIVDQLRLRNPDFPNVAKGVLVHRVQYNSPADKAGVQDNDVIIKIDDKDIFSTQDVFQALSKSNIQLTVIRGDKTIKLRIEPEEVL